MSKIIIYDTLYISNLLICNDVIVNFTVSGVASVQLKTEKDQERAMAGNKNRIGINLAFCYDLV